MKRSNGLLSIGFSALLLLLTLAFGLLVINSRTYAARRQLPQISDGTLSLKAVDFERNPYLPLNGGWRYTPDVLLQSGNEPLPQKATNAFVPAPVSQLYEQEKATLASYRLTLTDVPSGVALVALLPTEREIYRLYCNGFLVSSWKSAPVRLPIAADHTALLVLEIESGHAQAVFSTVQLAQQEWASRHEELSLAGNSLILGMLLLTLCIYGMLMALHDKVFRSRALLFVLCFVIALLSVRGKASTLLQLFFASARVSPALNACALVIVSFLPLMMAWMLCDLTQQPLTKAWKIGMLTPTVLGLTVVFLEKLGVLPMQFSWVGLALRLLVWALGLFIIYRHLNEPYVPAIGASYAVLLWGLMVDLSSDMGLFLWDMTLFLPLAALAFVLILVTVYLLKVKALEKEARLAHEKALALSEAELALQKSEARLMLSQIRPHFLYNALISIREVNKEDHEKANLAILQFAQYLRANMRSLTSDAPIPFHEELTHIRNYVAIEQLRFEDRLRMIYRVQTEDFFIPPLVIQPLVENAIKHGICKRLTGGTVTLTTESKNGQIILHVLDDGVGFEPLSQPAREDATGIDNIRRRISALQGASMTIKSCVDQGTDVEIRLPIRRMNDANAAGGSCG